MERLRLNWGFNNSRECYNHVNYMNNKARYSKYYATITSRTSGEPHEHTVLQILYSFKSNRCNVYSVLDKYAKHLPTEAWLILLDETNKLNKWSLSLEMFKWLQKQNWPRNSASLIYSKLITIMGKHGQLRLASWIFTEFSRSGYTLDTKVYNSIIMAHLRCKAFKRNLEYALKYFQDMKNTVQSCPDIITYNILTKACAEAGWAEKAEEFYTEMIRNGVKPNIFTFNGIIDAYGKLGNYYNMEIKLQQMKEHNLKPDYITFNTLIDAYGKAGDFTKMESVYKSMNMSKVKPTVPTFNSMVSNYGSRGRLAKMEQMLVRMDISGYGPDLGTYNALISSYGRAGEFETMHKCFNKMAQSSVKPQISTFDTILRVYVHHGMVEEAEGLFVNAWRISVKPEVTSYFILFGGYARECMLDKMVSLMIKMEQNGVESNEGFLLTALQSYAVSGVNST